MLNNQGSLRMKMSALPFVGKYLLGLTAQESFFLEQFFMLVTHHRPQRPLTSCLKSLTIVSVFTQLIS